MPTGDVQPFVSMNQILMNLSTITKRYEPPGGNAPWTIHQLYSSTKLQNIRYLMTSGESIRGNCKCRSWTVNWSHERLGPPKGLISLMAVIQHTNGKLLPVMDYRELNEHVDAFTADADICTTKLREWRQQEVNMALLDLRRTYLQV